MLLQRPGEPPGAAGRGCQVHDDGLSAAACDGGACTTPDVARTSVGFCGLDVYSLWSSIRALLDYLREHEPEHVEVALQAVRCFEPFREDPQDYAFASRFSPQTCETAVVELLGRLCAERTALVDGDDPEARFSAEQNAAVAAGAERCTR